MVHRRAAPVLPEPARRGARRPAGQPPAAPRDRHHLGGQRPGQPRRHDLRVPHAGGDRSQRRSSRSAPTASCARSSASRSSGRRSTALDNELPTHVQTMLYLESRRLLDRSGRWLVQARRASIDVAAEVEHFQAALDELAPLVPQLLVGLRARAAAAAGGRVRRARRARAAGGTRGRPAGHLLAARRGRDRDRRQAARCARWPASTSPSRSGSRSTACSPGSPGCRATTGGARWPGRRCGTTSTPRWPGSPRPSSRRRPRPTSPGERITAWEEQNAEGVARAQATLEEIVALDSYDLATLSVALRTIRTLLRG